MYKNVYGDQRILIVCGKYEGMSKKCADYLEAMGHKVKCFM